MDQEWIAARMRQLGVTQRMLACKMGLSPSALSHKLHGRRLVTLQEGAVIASVLDLSAQQVADHLLFGWRLRSAYDELRGADAEEGGQGHAA